MSTGLSLEDLRNLTISSYTHQGGIKVQTNEETPTVTADLTSAIKAIEGAKNLLEDQAPAERQKSANDGNHAENYIGVIKKFKELNKTEQSKQNIFIRIFNCIREIIQIGTTYDRKLSELEAFFEKAKSANQIDYTCNTTIFSSLFGRVRALFFNKASEPEETL